MSINNEKVSVVVPIYNINDEFLEKCIHTLVNQTYENIEIILINDGSTEGNRCICEKYQKLDGRVILINQENMGVSVARNKGIEIATGEWVCFVDPDDWTELDMIEKLQKHADNREKEIIICATYVNFKNKELKNNFFYKSGELCKADKNRLLIDTMQRQKGEKYAKHCAVGVPWGRLYNRNFLIKNNIRFVKGMIKEEDTIFNLYAFQSANWIEIYNDEYLYHYRRYSESMCNSYSSNVDLVVKKSIEEREKFIRKFYAEDKDFLRALNMYKIASINTIVAKNYFHEENKANIKEKYMNIKKIINEEIYIKAIKQTRINDCTKYYKLFLLALKMRNVYLLEKVFKLRKIKNIRQKNY